MSWTKSSRCSAAHCVEVAERGDMIAVRDSKEANGRVLLFSRRSWREFVDAIDAGEFDGLKAP